MRTHRKAWKRNNDKYIDMLELTFCLLTPHQQVWAHWDMHVPHVRANLSATPCMGPTGFQTSGGVRVQTCPELLVAPCWRSDGSQDFGALCYLIQSWLDWWLGHKTLVSELEPAQIKTYLLDPALLNATHLTQPLSVKPIFVARNLWQRFFWTAVYYQCLWKAVMLEDRRATIKVFQGDSGQNGGFENHANHDFGVFRKLKEVGLQQNRSRLYTRSPWMS